MNHPLPTVRLPRLNYLPAMPDERPTTSNRREFLTGSALRARIEAAGDVLADAITADETATTVPTGGPTVRLGTRAMACDFCVVMNPGPSRQIMLASDGLDLVHLLEDQMTVYRDDSQLSQLNRLAADEPVSAEPELFALLLQCRQLCRETDGCFDPTSGPLIALWRQCREEARVPTDEEITETLKCTGMDHVSFDETAEAIHFDKPGVELNLGGIGKGFALDRVGDHLLHEELDNWLCHGGRSSILARGEHNGQAGWPVGIRNPLFTEERLATILLRDCGMSTSGSNIQYFRHGGRRYGHILDPRTGWPVETMLSATVIAPTAAEADALSTAFFVMGLENARRYCDNREGIGAILIPPPRQGRRLEPIVVGVPDEALFFADND